MKTFLLFFVAFSFTTFLKAQSLSDEFDICTIQNIPEYRTSIKDDSSGAIIIFNTYQTQSGSDYTGVDIYAQRVDNNGTLLWGTANTPKPVCTSMNNQFLSDAIPDGLGGAFIAWDDYRVDAKKPEVYLQHINSNGDVLWDTSGIKISSSADRNKSGGRLCSDGNGGVMIYWNESIFDTLNNITTYSQIFGQHYDSAGIPKWNNGGALQVVTAPGMRKSPEVVSDGTGGAILFFVDTRNSQQAAPWNPDYSGIWIYEFSDLDIFAQRISNSGSRLWTSNGRPACNENSQQDFVTQIKKRCAVSDGAGGAVIVFIDNSVASWSYGLRAQKLNSNGIKIWQASGVAVSTQDHQGYVNNVVSDGTGGIVAVYTDHVGGFSNFNEVAIQRIRTDGTLVPNNFYGAFESNTAEIESDGSGSFIMSSTRRNFHLYSSLQKFDTSMIEQWPGGLPAMSGYSAQIVGSDPGSVFIICSEDLTNNPIRGSKLITYALPLKLLDFTAFSQRQQVLLRWVTTNEKNTSNFEIQRSSDNLEFYSIGKVSALASTSVNKTYEYTDTKPLSGNTYYRLKINDKDGQFTYSPVREIKLTNSFAIKMLGNPVRNLCKIEISSSKALKGSFVLLSSSGQQLIHFTKEISAGKQIVTFDLNRFSAGQYYLSLNNGDEVKQVSIQKL